MKKRLITLAMAIVFSVMSVSAAFAAEMEYDTLVDWDIKVMIPEGTQAVLSSDGNFYIYPHEDEGIPYVMVRAYEGFTDEEDFLDYFNDYMKKQYEDLEIIYGPEKEEMDGRHFLAVAYNYSIQGFEALDRRLVITLYDRTYMFASKEIDELDMTVDDLLEEVACQSQFLDPWGDVIEFEERPENALYWEDAEDGIEQLKEEGITGQFTAFDEAGFEMWIPDFLSPDTLPEGQPNPDTFIGFYTSEGQESYAAVQLVPSDFTLDDYRKLLEPLEEVEDINDFIVNDVPFIVYYMPENDVMCLTTVVKNKGILEFSFYPASDSDFIELAEFMAISIRPVK